MKQKLKYFSAVIVAFSLQMTCAFAQFNTIHEYGEPSVKFRANACHKKSCQPTADSLLADSFKTDLTIGYKKTDYSKLISLPLKRIHITSSFGRRFHPITKRHSLHNGIDLRASYEEVYSMLPGIVHKSGEDRRSGKYIIISTGDYKISYCHLSAIKVAKGDLVMAGTPIGITGNSGYSTAPHLHLTFRIAGKPHDPEILLRTAKTYLGT